MNDKHLNIKLLLSGLVILVCSLYMLLSLSDPLIYGELESNTSPDQLKAFGISLYLMMISIPMGYALSLYFIHKKHYKPAYFSIFWGVILLVFFILQILFFSWSSPLQWAILLLSGLLLLTHIFLS